MKFFVHDLQEMKIIRLQKYRASSCVNKNKEVYALAKHFHPDFHMPQEIKGGMNYSLIP